MTSKEENREARVKQRGLILGSLAKVWYTQTDDGLSIEHNEDNFIRCCKLMKDDVRKCSYCSIRFKCYTFK